MDESSDVLNDVSVADGSKSNNEVLLGVVEETVSAFLISVWLFLPLLFDGWSSNSVIKTGP